MPTIRAEFLEDRVKVRYHASTPYGFPDDRGTVEVPHAHIERLPTLPYFNPQYAWTEDVYVSGVDRTITFILTSYRTAGPPDEIVSNLMIYHKKLDSILKALEL